MVSRHNNIGNIEAHNVTFGDGSRAGDNNHYAAPQRERPSSNPSAKSRQVFVIHGRDEQARAGVFDLIRSLGLAPLEWEHLIREIGSGAPSLYNVVSNAPRFAQAVVALMTPDDIVELHPSLLEPHEVAAGGTRACQARPNVFIELGISLAVLPERTIVLRAGDMRWPADLEGLNYIRVTESADWCNKLAERLRTAGCPVDRTGTDWQRASRFSGLDAHRRRADLTDRGTAGRPPG